MKKILVVDDEKSIATAVSYAFKREGYIVDTASDGEEALEKVKSFQPAVMILDVMMPKLTGYEVCRKLENRRGMGIILLTVKNDIVDKVLGLELGADDYMTKPFDVRELVARAKALVRRMEKNEAPEAVGEITVGKVKVNLIQRTLHVANELVKLTPKEFDLIALLLANLEDLLDLVWGMDYAGGTRTVDIHMQRLRKKVGEAEPYLLQTVYGVGYKATAGINE
ncbi:response regulator transcription factor [Bacillus megaterium NBRC 15308 = ATCC 14581]|nr:response regulator transcription factor [Priestia megaterium NBRC 15308 = ATCC 14581]